MFSPRLHDLPQKPLTDLKKKKKLMIVPQTEHTGLLLFMVLFYRVSATQSRQKPQTATEYTSKRPTVRSRPPSIAPQNQQAWLWQPSDTVGGVGNVRPENTSLTVLCRG